MRKLIPIVAVLALMVASSCRNPVDPEPPTGVRTRAPSERAQLVTFQPQPGTYAEDIDVVLTCATGDACIYYTIDGSDPDSNSSEYVGPIAIHGHGTTMTIKAIAVADGYLDSDISSAHYEIDYDAVAMPSFSPPGGTYSSDLTVALSSATPGATIYYELVECFFSEAPDPTVLSSQYVAPIEISGRLVRVSIKAIAIADGYLNSTVSHAVYEVEHPPIVVLDSFSRVYARSGVPQEIVSQHGGDFNETVTSSHTNSSGTYTSSASLLSTTPSAVRITVEGTASDSGPFSALEDHSQEAVSEYSVLFRLGEEVGYTFVHAELRWAFDTGGTNVGPYSVGVSLSNIDVGLVFRAQNDPSASEGTIAFSEELHLTPGYYRLMAWAEGSCDYYGSVDFSGVGGGGFGSFDIDLFASYVIGK